MKKRITALALAFVMVMGTVALAAGTEKSITVTSMTLNINGQQVIPTKSNGATAEVFAYDGATYVPLRYLSELLGIQVEWDPQDPGIAKLVNVPTNVKTAAATTTGFHGEVTVTLSVEGDKLTNVTVVGEEETIGIGSEAVAHMGERMLAANSVEIDTMSGCTVTSAAIRYAASQALAKTGATLTPVEPAKVSTEVQEHTADVIVVGAGGAGLIAAATAAEEGASVIVLEKESIMGGNTVRSEGFSGFMPSGEFDESKVPEMTEGLEQMLSRYIDYKTDDPELKALQDTVKKQYEDRKAAGNNKVLCTPELHALYTVIGGDGVGRVDLALALAQNDNEAHAWLTTLPGMEGSYLRLGAASVGTGNGGLWVNGGMLMAPEGKRYSAYDKFIYAPYTDLSNHGGEVVLEMEATELIQSSNRVTGVKATGRDGSQHVYYGTKGVILATGGYGANAEMVLEHGGITCKLTTDGPGTTGDGIVMAQAIGAGTEGMDYVQLHMHGTPVTGLLSKVHGSTTNPIYVNIEGKRFVNENGTRAELSNATLKQTGEKMYSIFDSRNSSDLIEAEVGHEVYKADTLEELADMVGINKENLLSTVKEYNAAVTENRYDLEPGRFVYGYTIEEGPFYCTPLTPTIHHTMGGVAIDTQARVMDTKGAAIDGLYACGEVTGGIHGSNRGAGQALTDCLVFGHIAGQTVLSDNP